MPRARNKKSLDRIVSEYERCAEAYKEMAIALRELISDLIEAEGIPIHSVTCRVKSRDSLVGKLQRDGSRYDDLSDITDVCGVRVITYFPDAVDAVARILEREFTIDKLNSIDKRSDMDPDRFGYLSVHHIVTIGVQRARLAEYRRFSGYKAEIQTRSLLQHTWAEIEHDLGYKSATDVPRSLRRGFARLAGLLELADEEFQRIRDGLKEYEHDVASRISDAPQTVELDKASLAAFVTSSTLLAEVDAGIARINGAKLFDPNPDYLDGDAEKLLSVGVTSIADLEKTLDQHRDTLQAFAEEFLAGDEHPAFDRGISLFYLWYILLVKEKTPQQVRQAIEDENLGPPDDRNEFADSLLEMYRKALERTASIRRGRAN